MKSPAGKLKVLKKQDLYELLKAYHAMGEILSTLVDPHELYHQEFVKGLEHSLQEVSRKKTKPVHCFSDFVS